MRRSQKHPSNDAQTIAQRLAKLACTTQAFNLAEGFLGNKDTLYRIKEFDCPAWDALREAVARDKHAAQPSPFAQESTIEEALKAALPKERWPLLDQYSEALHDQVNAESQAAYLLGLYIGRGGRG